MNSSQDSGLESWRSVRAFSVMIAGMLVALAGCNGQFNFDVPGPQDGGSSDASPPLDATLADAAPMLDATGVETGLDDGGHDAAVVDAAIDSDDSEKAADAAADSHSADAGLLSDPGTDCGDAGFCAAGSALCCSSSSGFACIASGQAICQGVRILCDDSAGCPGSAPYCCTELSNGNVSEVECKQSCTGSILCDPYDAKCPNGMSCRPIDAGNLPPGYTSCQ